jgi:hypothetical protein
VSGLHPIFIAEDVELLDFSLDPMEGQEIWSEKVVHLTNLSSILLHVDVGVEE